MRVVFDENVPDKIVEGLVAFTTLLDHPVKEITSISLLGKTGTPDELVLELVGNNGILFSYDKDFKTHKKLRSIISKYNIGVFWIQQPKKADFFTLARWILNHWESIIEIIIEQKRPSIYQVKKDGVTRLEL